MIMTAKGVVRDDKVVNNVGDNDATPFKGNGPIIDDIMTTSLSNDDVQDNSVTTTSTSSATTSPLRIAML